MGNGYGTPAGDGSYDELTSRLRETDRRLREVETQRGTQLADTVAQLRLLVLNLATAIANVASSGAVWMGGVSSGAATIQAAAGNISTTSGYIFTPAGYAFDITYTRRTAWLGNDGRLGWASSSITAKELIRTIAEPDALAIMSITSEHYHRKAEIAKRDDPSSDNYVGPDYHVATEWGAIAEQLHELGLWQAVIYEWDTVWDLRDVLDGDGQPIMDEAGMHLRERVPGSERRVESSEPRPVGVHYELIGLLAVVAVRYVHEEVADVRAELSELKKFLAA